MKILEKNSFIAIDKESKQEAGKQVYYFGAGWDAVGAGSDLDLFVLPLGENGKALPNSLVYYANQKAPGIQLSEDNTTGEGDGDDEDVIINTAELNPDVKGLVIGIVCFKGDDFSKVANPHIRGCDGDNETANEIFQYPIKENAESGDTVLIACELKKEGNEWGLKAIGDFKRFGQGTSAFTALFNSFA